MNLIAYSDSESDGEASAAAPAPKPAPKAFQKVVDRSNPGRIKLNLPGASAATTNKDDIESEAPPAKKARIGGGGGGGLGGFNSMLPAPKKANVKAPAASATPGSRGLGKGLGANINLRTGAEPAFKREQKLELEEYDEQGNVIKKEPMKKEDFRAMFNLPAPKSEHKASPKPESAAPTPQITEDVPAQKPSAPRFVPMSVGKGKKKKPIARPVAAPTQENRPAPALIADAQPPKKPKVSLFGVSQEIDAPANEKSSGAYQPMMYGFDEDEDEDDAPGVDQAFGTLSTHQPAQYAPTPAAPNDLTNIASELNLSEAERRQLFGKKGRNAPDFSSAKIVEFNTDTEYAHNEQLRQQGEQVQHNPLKSISGTGKNSLRSLVSVATTQKDALEEHFASSHRNKKEAGNRYGW
jgi:hypothetical protein